MKLHEQNTVLRQAVAAAVQELWSLRASIARKTAAPYPDGTHSVMINANSDVLPRLVELERELSEALAGITN